MDLGLDSCKWRDDVGRMERTHKRRINGGDWRSVPPFSFIHNMCCAHGKEEGNGDRFRMGLEGAKTSPWKPYACVDRGTQPSVVPTSKSLNSGKVKSTTWRCVHIFRQVLVTIALCTVVKWGLKSVIQFIC
jgi:hypothetical protein